MRNIRLTVAYDGTDFSGWATQHGARTVQGVLSSAITKITGSSGNLRGSSRTDAGVHALGQIAAFQTLSKIPLDAFPRAINANLPDDVIVLSADEVPENYNPCANTIKKRYRYLLYDGLYPDIFMRNYSWRPTRGRKRLRADLMQQAAVDLIGLHDFSAYENVGSPRTNSIRNILDIHVYRAPVPNLPAFFPMMGHPDDYIAVEVEADGFLYNMVRNITGTLVEVGTLRRSISFPLDALLSLSRSQSGPTAPPQGLFLLWIEQNISPLS